MTREEAIELLQEKIDDSPLFKDEREAFAMAIEALSSDVVSRDVYDKRTKADEEIIDSYRREFQRVAEVEVIHKMIQNGMIKLPQEYVKVTRCKDCKYGEERIEDYRCWMLDEDWDIRFSPMHFCSYGRCREENEHE